MRDAVSCLYETRNGKDDWYIYYRYTVSTGLEMVGLDWYNLQRLKKKKSASSEAQKSFNQNSIHIIIQYMCQK